MQLNPIAQAFPSHDQAFCQTCNQMVQPTVLDFGIGLYEFWGMPDRDILLAAVCPICNRQDFLHPETFEPLEVTIAD